MPEDIDYPQGFADIVMKLHHEERERMEQLLQEHHHLKTDYERRYHLQVDNLNMNNRKFGEKQKMMRPYDYAKSLDKKLMMEARHSLQEQKQMEEALKEERQRREEAKQPKPARTPDMNPRSEAFREQSKDIDDMKKYSKTEEIRVSEELKGKVEVVEAEKRQKAEAKEKESQQKRDTFREQAQEVKDRQHASKADEIRYKMEQKQKAKALEKEKMQEKEIDPRRLEFRREMEQLNKENEKQRDKDREKDVW